MRAKLSVHTFKQMDAQAMFNAFENGEIDAAEASHSGTAEMLSNFLGMENTRSRHVATPALLASRSTLPVGRLKDICSPQGFVCINTETILGSSSMGR